MPKYIVVPISALTLLLMLPRWGPILDVGPNSCGEAGHVELQQLSPARNLALMMSDR